jgi:hypothetical protein
MGCVWQSDYAPDSSLDHPRVAVRPAARHRKPPRWRRAAAGFVPLVSAATARYRPPQAAHRVGRVARVAPLARGR